ncbi:MAG: hypothetical protein ACI8SE_000595 [Bacteroidia bacterium]
MYLNKSPGQIWITDQNDASGFSTFRDTLLQILALEHQSKGARKEAQITTEKRVGSEEVRQTHLVQKRSFYKTITAKVLTILFMALAVTLLTFNEYYGLSLRHVYRLEFVIVPGVMYMIYRVFVKVED